MDEITKLADEYQRLIGQDHHKDRDCHWYIQTRWSYGQKPVYDVIHFGYCYKKVDEEYPTYMEALQALQKHLVVAIKDVKEMLDASNT